MRRRSDCCVADVPEVSSRREREDRPGFVFLEPLIIFGAMLGDVGFQMPINLSGHPKTPRRSVPERVHEVRTHGAVRQGRKAGRAGEYDDQCHCGC